jgi:preprotein translocase SecE subunit
VARDRKRAKQRRARRRPEPAKPAPTRQSAGRTAGSAEIEGSSLGHGQVERADLPGALEHAGEVDEFDAALIAGAGGVPASPAADLDSPVEDGVAPAEDQLQIDGVPPGSEGADGGGSPPGDGAAAVAEVEHPSGAPVRSGNRAIGFLRASWAELQRVQWPDRRQVFQATAVVLGFVAIAGLYLGAADFVAQEIVEFILT